MVSFVRDVHVVEGRENVVLAQHIKHGISSTSESEYILVRFPAVTGVRRQVDARYERAQGERIWSLCRKVTQRMRKVSDAELAAIPERASICGTDHVPVRTAKLHITFREKLLRRMLEGQKVLSNMVLFQCTTCNERFPTWHPDHKPDFELECLKECDIEVYHWNDAPGAELTRHATLHRGCCARCHKSLEKVKDKPIVHDVATFSCLLYTSPSPRDLSTFRMPSSA